MDYRRHIYLIFRLVCFAATVSAFLSGARGERLPVKTYTSADGLVHDYVKSIVRDPRGFLWFCTLDGLSRFDGHSFRNYGTWHSLPKADFNDLLVTREGRYWLASNSHGAILFNPFAPSLSTVTASGPASPEVGKPNTAAFTIYRVGDSVRTNRVNVVYQDRAGRIWAGTERGLFYLDELQGVFRRVEISFPTQANQTSYVGSLIEDSEGSLWIGTSRSLLRRLPDGRIIQYLLTPTRASAMVEALLIDQRARLWIGSHLGLGILVPEPLASLTTAPQFSQRVSPENAAFPNLRKGQVVLPSAPGESHWYTVADGLTHDRINSLHQTRDGHIWLGTDTGGLAEFDGQRYGGGLTEFDGSQFRGLTGAHGLSGSPVQTVNEDIEGNLWVGTRTRGAMKLTRNGLITYARGDGLADDAITSIFENRAGELWVVSGNSLVNRFDGSRFTTGRMNIPPELSAPYLWRRMVLQDHTGEWWVSTVKGLYRFPHADDPIQLARLRPKMVYTTKDGLPSDDVYRLFEDSRGDVWIGTEGQNALTRWERATNTFRAYGEKDGLRPSNPAVSFQEDRQGNLWAGFFYGGIARYSQGRFLLLFAAEPALAGTIWDIYLDRAERLWVASDQGGLSRIDDPEAAHPRLVTYTTTEGLSSHLTRGISEDHCGRLYVGTLRGVDRLDPATGHVEHYTTADGLGNNRVQASFRDGHGAYWFGTTHGISRLRLEPDRPATPPPVLIDGLRVAGIARPISLVGETNVPGFELDSDQGHIQIDFLSLNFRAGERPRYQYRIEGADTDWNKPTELRTVNYANLRPGQYRFLVRAVNSEGIVSLTPASVTFTLLPPIWRRWWSLLLTVTVAVAAAYALHRYRLARMLELERVRIRIATDLHDDLGANLSQIAILSEVVRQRLGDTNGHVGEPLALVTSAARESVDAMADIVWAINPKRDHLRDLTQRMRHFASEVLTARDIKLQFHAPDREHDPKLGVDLRREVFLIFKEAVNNLVRHSGCTAAGIEFVIQDGRLRLRLDDNGRGFDPAETNQGHGLQSMRARARKLGGELTIISRPGEGTMLTLDAPLVPRRTWRRQNSHMFR